MKKNPLRMDELYIIGKLRDKKTESEHLKILAKKITKVPDTIHIPKEYLVGEKL